MTQKYQVFLCISHKPRIFGGGCCNDKGSEDLLEELKSLIKEHGLSSKVEINSSSCLKNCLNGPSILVLPGRVMYGKITSDDLKTIVSQHFKEGKPVRKLIKTPGTSILG
ncbi:MAG: (2Fe-2S) ferredoxin domain-containing protein [Bacteroidia bacterium]|nr:(2Fe-2S) ferredoxin domain-containing protein [Bacteroidia bacterium]